MEHATKEGTRRYQVRLTSTGIPPTSYRLLGRTGLTTSTLGFGSYRIDEGIEDHETALRTALAQGCNLIDTSTNYSDGGSESLIGKVLASVDREEVIVVSKVGYVQGQNLELATEKESKGDPFPDMVKFREDCWHCLHPTFIEDQLTRSLERLQLDSLDVYLLHNPEYFFTLAAEKRISDLEGLRKDFYARIRLALQQLEKEVQAGRIRFYGVSSNTMAGATESAETVSLTRLWEIAQEITPDHHFAVVQMPGNLFEGDMVRRKNNGAGDQTVLEFAQKQDLAVLINRPLNSVSMQQLVRLADFKRDDNGPSFPEQMGKVLALEEEFAGSLALHIQTAPNSPSATQFFRWGRELSHPELTALGVERWNDLKSAVIRPRLFFVVEQLNQFMVGELRKVWEDWRDRYLKATDRLFKVIDGQSALVSQQRSETIHDRLNPLLPESLREKSLSQKALAVLMNTKGVTTVLNGMRTLKYTEDSLQAMQIPPFEVTAKLYVSLAE
jgi:uncharacterized protein